MFKHIKNLFPIISIVVVGLLLQAQSSSSDSSGLICYVILCPLWLISIWYWWRHYYVRKGLGYSIFIGIVVFIFSGIGVGAMVLDFLYRAITGNNPEIGPCPNCGKNKIVSTNSNPQPHSEQPQCPHCKQWVGGAKYAFVQTPSQSHALQDLNEMRTKGLITEEEYQLKKEEILKRL